MTFFSELKIKWVENIQITTLYQEIFKCTTVKSIKIQTIISFLVKCIYRKKRSIEYINQNTKMAVKIINNIFLLKLRCKT